MGNLLRALQAHGVAWRKASPFALKCRGVFPGVSSPSRQVSGETPLQRLQDIQDKIPFQSFGV